MEAVSPAAEASLEPRSVPEGVGRAVSELDPGETIAREVEVKTWTDVSTIAEVAAGGLSGSACDADDAGAGVRV
jgi:hypothetical protein